MKNPPAGGCDRPPPRWITLNGAAGLVGSEAAHPFQDGVACLPALAGGVLRGQVLDDVKRLERNRAVETGMLEGGERRFEIDHALAGQQPAAVVGLLGGNVG